MSKTNQNFTMYAGDTETVQVSVTDSSNVATDLTGATIDWYMKRGSNDSNFVLHKSTSSGISITNAAGGVFQITLSPSDTSNLIRGTYWHEAVVTDSIGDVSTVTTGIVTIE